MPILRENLEAELWELLSRSEAVVSGIYDVDGWALAQVPESPPAEVCTLIPQLLDQVSDVTMQPSRRCRVTPQLLRVQDGGILMMAIRLPSPFCHLSIGIGLQGAEDKSPEATSQLQHDLANAAKRLPKLITKNLPTRILNLSSRIPVGLPAALLSCSRQLQSVILLDGDGFLLSGKSRKRIDVDQFAGVVLNLPGQLLAADRHSDRVSLVANGDALSIFRYSLGHFILAAISSDPRDAALLAGLMSTLTHRRDCSRRIATTTAVRRHPTPMPAAPADEVLVHSMNGKTFHFPWCKHVKRMSRRNLRWLHSRSEAIQRDLLPCPLCTGRREKGGLL